MASFDNPFDNTFLAPGVATPATLGESGCADTYRLGWVTDLGICYWTFEAPYEQSLNAESFSSYVQQNIRRDTRRQAEPTLLLRSANLDVLTRKVLSTVFNSPSVFLLVVDGVSGTLSATPVRVVPGQYTIVRSNVPYEGFSVQVTQPVRQSFRNL